MSGSPSQGSALCREIARLALGALLLTCGAYGESIGTPRLTCEVEQAAEITALTAKANGSGDAVAFRVDWTSAGAKAEAFKLSPAERGRITSTHRFGKTTVTRTILASAAADCILIHVIADQPGWVSLNARFASEHPSRIRNRREIHLSGKKTQAHAWVLPFESDVHDDDGKGTIFLNGEGEALIILNLTGDAKKHPAADTLWRLGRKYDPNNSPPDPRVIWEGAMEDWAKGGEGGKG